MFSCVVQLSGGGENITERNRVSTPRMEAGLPWCMLVKMSGRGFYYARLWPLSLLFKGGGATSQHFGQNPRAGLQKGVLLFGTGASIWCGGLRLLKDGFWYFHFHFQHGQISFPTIFWMFMEASFLSTSLLPAKSQNRFSASCFVPCILCVLHWLHFLL